MSTPAWALTKINKVKENKHDTLDLSFTQVNRGLTFSITSKIDENPLSEIPKEVFEIKNLRQLILKNNTIKQIPDDIKNNSFLTYLDLSHNNLSVFPDSVLDLPKLKTLNLSANSINTLPERIKTMQNLVTLNLSQNQISELPNGITHLSALENLTLYRNFLVDIPIDIYLLERLQILDLRRNNITSIPSSIAKISNLLELKLLDNPLVTPPLEIASRGATAVQEYFRQIETQGHDQLYEAKLLILGEGGAGKTTLAKKILDEAYRLQEEKITEGVDVITWSFAFNGDRHFRVNIWDFGGQEIYHATHQFFLTKRSLYALVADTRKEDTDFYYWLNVVELLSENSPIIIVKNEKQDRHRDLNERQLRGQFENLREISSVNLATNRGLAKLKEEIEYYIKKLPHIGSPLPKTWVRVREQLENDRRNFISIDEYFSICKKNGFLEVKDNLQLSNYLHDIGVFLHFQDDPVLSKTVILKPKWGTDAVYKVLDNIDVIKNLGRFTRDDLSKIWKEHEYENMHHELLQLMMRFKLCYEIPSRRGSYIAPQLLSESQPDYTWDENENLILRYSYEFMPKGILLQFIVVMSEHIWQQNVWRSGVVLEKDHTKAEVIEYYGKRELKIRVKGPHKKDLMTVITHEIDQIQSTYKRLKCDKLIPCNCSDCKNHSDPHFYKHEQLQNFMEKSLNEIQCGANGEMVNVRSLIDDVVGWTPNKEIEEMIKKQNPQKITVENLSISGNAKIDNFNLGGVSKVSINKIEHSNASNELKETLMQLTDAVDLMSKSLPIEQSKEVTEDLEKLIEEATKETPRHKWYSISIEGLIKAAENLDKLGKPVISLSRKVLSLLTGNVIK